MPRRIVVCTLGLLALLVPLLAACGHTSQSSAKQSSNVIGRVVLKEPGGLRSGAGLTVTATKQGNTPAAARVRTAADGSFRMELSAGWYLLSVRYWGGPAIQVQVPVKGTVSAGITAPTQALAVRETVSLTDVPDPVPPRGAWVDGHLVLIAPQRSLVPNCTIQNNGA